MQRRTYVSRCYLCCVAHYLALTRPGDSTQQGSEKCFVLEWSNNLAFDDEIWMKLFQIFATVQILITTDTWVKYESFRSWAHARRRKRAWKNSCRFVLVVAINFHRFREDDFMKSALVYSIKKMLSDGINHKWRCLQQKAINGTNQTYRAPVVPQHSPSTMCHEFGIGIKKTKFCT